MATEKCDIKVIDRKTGFNETVFEKTSNSYHVTQGKITDKGIDSTNWFEEKRFKERFEN